MIPEQNTLILRECLIAECDGNSCVPSRLLIGAWALVGAQAIDEGGTGQIVRVALRTFRNLNRLADSAIRDLRAIAGAGDYTVFDDSRFRYRRHRPLGLVIEGAVGFGENRAAVSSVDTKLRAVESIGGDGAKEQRLS